MAVAFRSQDNAYFQAASGSGTLDDPYVPSAGSVTLSPVRSSTVTRANVAGAAVSTTILAANSGRNGATVYNDSSAVLYLELGSAAASTTNFTIAMAANSYYEVPFGYTGQLTGIWASATGAARVTELTA